MMITMIICRVKQKHLWDRIEFSSGHHQDFIRTEELHWERRWDKRRMRKRRAEGGVKIEKLERSEEGEADKPRSREAEDGADDGGR